MTKVNIPFSLSNMPRSLTTAAVCAPEADPPLLDCKCGNVSSKNPLFDLIVCKTKNKVKTKDGTDTTIV